MSGILDLPKALKLARNYAMTGYYNEALVQYKIAVSIIQARRTELEESFLSEKWKLIEKELLDEMKHTTIVRELCLSFHNGIFDFDKRQDDRALRKDPNVLVFSNDNNKRKDFKPERFGGKSPFSNDAENIDDLIHRDAVPLLEGYGKNNDVMPPFLNSLDRTVVNIARSDESMQIDNMFNNSNLLGKNSTKRPRGNSLIRNRSIDRNGYNSNGQANFQEGGLNLKQSLSSNSNQYILPRINNNTIDKPSRQSIQNKAKQITKPPTYQNNPKKY